MTADKNTEEGRFPQFKNHKKHEHSRRQRAEEIVEIRKKKGQFLIEIRRNLPEIDDPEPFESIEYPFKPQEIVELLTNENESLTNKSVNLISELVIRSRDQTDILVNVGIIDPLLKLSVLDDQGISKRALFAISNIVGTSPIYRDKVIQNPEFREILKFWMDNINGLGSVVAWTLSNICGHLEIPEDIVPGLLMAFSKVLENDLESRRLSCDAIRYLRKEHRELVDSSGILQLIPSFLHDQNQFLVLSALRLLDSVDLGMIEFLLKSPDPEVILECLNHLTSPQKGKIIKSGIIENLAEILENQQFKCQLKVSKVLFKIAENAYPEQITEMISIVPSIFRVLNHGNAEFLDNLLETLYIILFTVNFYFFKLDQLREKIDEEKGVDAILQLLNHESKKVSWNAFRINDQFFTDY